MNRSLREVPRFVTEYAEYQKQCFRNNDLMKIEILDKAIWAIDKSISLYQRNMLSLAETMDIITHPISWTQNQL